MKTDTATDAVSTLESVLGWARTREYRGYDYADGLSSPIRGVLPIDHPWANIAIQELPKRFPINIRPLLAIPRRRSFKGTGLFILANIAAYEATGDDRYRAEAVRLGRWLWASRRTDPFGWGHNHPLQTLSGEIPRNTPSVVTVTYATRGLLAVEPYEQFIAPDQLAGLVRDLFVNDLDYAPTATGATIQYRAHHHVPYTIINANALGAGILAELAAATDRPELASMAEALLRYVASQQTAIGGWYYADPSTASHLSMDNHHNGFIIESFLRYQNATEDTQFDSVIEEGLEFYRNQLFESDGAPRWDETRAFPRDIHGAAQGIITFAMADDPDFAQAIFEWTVDHLSDDGVAFYFRAGRWWTNRTTLMRWCQAWMAVACGTLVAPNLPPARLSSRPETRG